MPRRLRRASEPDDLSMHPDVGGDASNIIGVAGDHRRRLANGLEHLPEVGIGNGYAESGADRSGPVRSYGIETPIAHSHTVHDRRSWGRAVPSGFYSYGRGDNETLRAGALQVPPGGRLHQSQGSAVLSVCGIGERLHRFVVEQNGTGGPHATAAARPAAYRSTSSAEGSSRHATISSAARRMRSGRPARGLPSSSAAARAISARSGLASGCIR